MALHFPVKINGYPIGGFYAQRHERVEDIPEDGVCTYDVRITHNSNVYRITVKHNRDDGAFVLIRKALEALELGGRGRGRWTR